MKYTININGLIGSEKEVLIPVIDRGFLYGDSVYEVTMVQNHCPLFLEEHLNRLWISASKIAMNINFSKEDITLQVNKTIKKHNSKSETLYLRIIMTRGEGEINLDPNCSDKNNLIIIVKDLKKSPDSWYKNGVKVVTIPRSENHQFSTNPSVKSGNYLHNVMALHHAKKMGAFDALMVNSKGLVSEATTSNLWIIKNQIFYTPPISSEILEGITRRKIIELCIKNDILYKEKSLSIEEVENSDECFLTSSARGILPISKVNNSSINNGKPGIMTQKISQIYNEYIHSYLYR